jgi:hypothetical protein
MFGEFRPSTDSELAALETTAAARWHRLRSLSRKCAFQRVALDRDIAFQDANLGPGAVRAVAAFAAPNALKADPRHPLLYPQFVPLCLERKRFQEKMPFPFEPRK